MAALEGAGEEDVPLDFQTEEEEEAFFARFHAARESVAQVRRASVSAAVTTENVI